MKLKSAILALAAASIEMVQADFHTSTSSVGLWNSSRWNATSDAVPYTSAWVANSASFFNAGSYSFDGAISSGGTVNVGNITLANGTTVNFTAGSGALGTGGVVRTITVGAGSLLDFGSQLMSGAIGTGFIKDGAGVMATAGGAYSGSFTLNAGTLIARAVNAMGGDTGNVLTLNGGTVASNGNRDFSVTKYGGGIVIGGNVKFGELSTNVALASSSATLTFANIVSLGAATRTITIGNNGSHAFLGVINGAAGTGLTVAAASGVTGNITLGGINTYTGATTIKGGKLVLSLTGTIANSTSIVVGDGGSSGAVLDTTAKPGFTIATAQTLSGVGTVNVGFAKALSISGVHSVGNAGTDGGVGTQAVTGNLSYASDSIFNWDLDSSAITPDPGVVVNDGSYDKVTATGTITGASSVFNVVLGAGKSFSDAFWNTDKSWTNIFSGSSAPNLASIFTTFGGAGITPTGVLGVVEGQGQFSFTSSALTWSAVPEPSSALVGVLLAAGLLRRRRVA